jgi:hypothetical protein
MMSPTKLVFATTVLCFCYDSTQLLLRDLSWNRFCYYCSMFLLQLYKIVPTRSRADEVFLRLFLCFRYSSTTLLLRGLRQSRFWYRSTIFFFDEIRFAIVAPLLTMRSLVDDVGVFLLFHGLTIFWYNHGWFAAITVHRSKSRKGEVDDLIRQSKFPQPDDWWHSTRPYNK